MTSKPLAGVKIYYETNILLGFLKKDNCVKGSQGNGAFETV